MMLLKSSWLRRKLALVLLTLLGAAFSANAQTPAETAPTPPPPMPDKLTGKLPGNVDPVGEAIDLKLNQQESSIHTQREINEIADATQEMVEEYRLLLTQIENLRIYNRQMERIVNSQEEEIASIEGQLGQLQETQRQLIPLMLRMIDELEAVVESDIPFLYEERTNRVNTLRNLMDRGDISIAEKYRKVLEAYQIENEYARNIEAYEGELGDRLVDFFRLGRVGLYYQTKDDTETGWFNPQTGQFEVLEEGYFRSAIDTGIKMANKQVAPELLRLPAQAPTDAN